MLQSRVRANSTSCWSGLLSSWRRDFSEEMGEESLVFFFNFLIFLLSRFISLIIYQFLFDLHLFNSIEWPTRILTPSPFTSLCSSTQIGRCSWPWSILKNDSFRLPRSPTTSTTRIWRPCCCRTSSPTRIATLN